MRTFFLGFLQDGAGLRAGVSGAPCPEILHLQDENGTKKLK